MSETYEAATTISAHAAQIAVRVEISHSEIVPGSITQKDEAICADAESAITKRSDLFGFQTIEFAFTVVNDNEIVTGALIL